MNLDTVLSVGAYGCVLPPRNLLSLSLRDCPLSDLTLSRTAPRCTNGLFSGLVNKNLFRLFFFSCSWKRRTCLLPLPQTFPWGLWPLLCIRVWISLNQISPEGSRSDPDERSPNRLQLPDHLQEWGGIIIMPEEERWTSKPEKIHVNSKELMDRMGSLESRAWYKNWDSWDLFRGCPRGLPLKRLKRERPAWAKSQTRLWSQSLTHRDPELPSTEPNHPRLRQLGLDCVPHYHLVIAHWLSLCLRSST